MSRAVPTPVEPRATDGGAGRAARRTAARPRLLACASRGPEARLVSITSRPVSSSSASTATCRASRAMRTPYSRAPRKECRACHGVGTAIRATAKTATHILSTDECGACHTPIACKPAVNFDHTQARGSCSTCHNGVAGAGQAADAHRDGPGMRRLPHDADAGPGRCSPTRRHRELRQLPQRRAGDRHAGNHIPSRHAWRARPATRRRTSRRFAGAQINHPAVTALSCASCHETAAYLGMKPSTATSAADSRPPVNSTRITRRRATAASATIPPRSPATRCRPANHIPTSAPCAQCHTTPGNYALYSVTGTHQGVTNCLSCHGPTVATTFANITITTHAGQPHPDRRSRLQWLRLPRHGQRQPRRLQARHRQHQRARP